MCHAGFFRAYDANASSQHSILLCHQLCLMLCHLLLDAQAHLHLLDKKLHLEAPCAVSTLLSNSLQHRIQHLLLGALENCDGTVNHPELLGVGDNLTKLLLDVGTVVFKKVNEFLEMGFRQNLPNAQPKTTSQPPSLLERW